MSLPFTPLPLAFYARDVLDVAPDCVGKIVVHAAPEGLLAGRIVECEAYRGPEDQAAHSANGRRTARTEVMFGAPGRAYLFLLYGASWALNLVTGREGEPQAVLIRALQPLVGADLMSARRGFAEGRRELTNGPGKLCHALGLDRRFYGTDLTAPPLFLADGPVAEIGCSPRIRIPYAGSWVEKPWRFFERKNQYVSVPPRI